MVSEETEVAGRLDFRVEEDEFVMVRREGGVDLLRSQRATLEGKLASQLQDGVLLRYQICFNVNMDLSACVITNNEQ